MAKASDDAPADGEPVSFGYSRVDAEEHPGLVREIFDSVAGRYDLMNDLMSGGLHRAWKSALLDRLNPRPGTTLLDVAGGTGDVAFGYLKRARARGGTARAVICDVNARMLAVGADRALDRGIVAGLSIVCGDAESLPFASGTADACTIAFGLRNVTRRAPALEEMRRVLRPGGRMLCLEFSRPVVPLLAPLYDLYSFRVLPALGARVAGDAEAYRYLAESIRAFPDQDSLAEEIRRAGFDNVDHRNLSGGIVALHTGWRL
jgi:demethylmenaquinone methyltransferase/2-methoxy-6-polyprenyl-1,4-benzoquinol methylase